MSPFSLKKTVHGVLTDSYMVYVVCILLGIFTDAFFTINLTSYNLQYFGVFCMVLSPLLISSAQKASRRFKQVHLEREITVEDFMHGPYRFLQSPTHMGIFLLSMGFAMVSNSAILILAILFAYIITHTIFLPAEQKLLKKKYGAAYEVYLKKVKLSI